MLLGAIRALCEGGMAALKVTGMESEWLRVRGSVRQGCTLLFNLSIDSVVKEATGELVR